ncbi:MAG: hypothetical protein P1P82_09285 [Bacteroidales bacterium]|nr:hypothetical protein [Bacteroidales bacterium]MDT8432062.1 hypothetical protein [Bacteroidales bacterium]
MQRITVLMAFISLAIIMNTSCQDKKALAQLEEQKALLEKSEKNKFPQGAWKNVKFQHIFTDSLGKTVTNDYNIDFLKMWSEKNFSFIGHWKQDTLIRDFYGGGTYKLEGNRYEEHVVYHFTQPGKVMNYTLKALIELKNDTLIQISPVDDNGQIDKKSYSIEKYIQVK